MSNNNLNPFTESNSNVHDEWRVMYDDGTLNDIFGNPLYCSVSKMGRPYAATSYDVKQQMGLLKGEFYWLDTSPYLNGYSKFERHIHDDWKKIDSYKLIGNGIGLHRDKKTGGNYIAVYFPIDQPINENLFKKKRSINDALSPSSQNAPPKKKIRLMPNKEFMRKLDETEHILKR